jgi:hypothetical protein
MDFAASAASVIQSTKGMDFAASAASVIQSTKGMDFAASAASVIQKKFMEADAEALGFSLLALLTR